MIEDRHAVVSGVPGGTRGGILSESLCRFSGQAQVSRSGARARVWRTTHRDRQSRGDWTGEHSLRQDAVFSALRQPVAIKPLVSRKSNENKNQSYSTRGVGTTAETRAKKNSTQCRGETLAVYRGRQDRRLANPSSMV